MALCSLLIFCLIDQHREEFCIIVLKVITSLSTPPRQSSHVHCQRCRYRVFAYHFNLSGKVCERRDDKAIRDLPGVDAASSSPINPAKHQLLNIHLSALEETKGSLFTSHSLSFSVLACLFLFVRDLSLRFTRSKVTGSFLC